MKGGVVLVFIILLQLAMADVWGDLWKKVQVTANDESTRVLEKVNKEIGRWQKRLNESKEQEKYDPPPPQLPIDPVVEPLLPTPPPPTLPPTSPHTTTTEVPLPLVTAPLVSYSLTPSPPPETTSAPTVATTIKMAADQPSSTLSWTIGIISVIFVGFGAIFSVVLLAVLRYRRGHPSVPPFPPPEPPRILVERVYAPYLRMNEDRSQRESEYSSIGMVTNHE